MQRPMLSCSLRQGMTTETSMAPSGAASKWASGPARRLASAATRRSAAICLVSTGQDYSLFRFASALLDELGHQRGPARLVTGADTGAVVAVEILGKLDVIAPMGVGLE